ncbi:MAG: hypothetical protein HY598_01170 [Candidatus Omnitrophica bacterium]|nr:hypothetical protein [Candidatus Omnitrophota bacterium]
MTEEEIRVRSVYLFLACSQTVEQCKQRLIATLPTPPLSSRLLLDRAIARELGLLFRYWATRYIWERLGAEEADAKQLNLALLRLFTSGLKLPRDGSGLRYAEMSSVAEHARELGHRMTSAIGIEHPPLLAELQGTILAWREAVLRHTMEALQWPLEPLTKSIKEWAERRPEIS